MPATNSNLIPNDQGGITYARAQRIGQREQRSEILANVRMVIDAALELQRITRESWPLDYPVPPEVDRINNFVDYAIARARGGALKNFGEMA